MAPTRDVDPRQAIAAAVVVLRICGGLSLLLGLMASLPLALVLLRRAPLTPSHLLYFSLVAVVAVGPAIAYLVLPTYLHRRRRWAAAAGMIVAAFHALCALAGAAVAVPAFVARGAGRFAAAPVVGALVIAIVCAMLLYCLDRARRAFDAPDFSGPRGFEALPPSGAPPPGPPADPRDV